MPRFDHERTFRELRHAARILAREPLFCAGVILTIALAIGANAAMVGLVSRLMLAAPPGVRDAERIATVGLRYDEVSDGFVAHTTSFETFRLLRDADAAFSGVAAFRPDTVTLGRSPELTLAGVLAVTGDYFTTLGAQPAMGRLLTASDDELPAGNAVVVLGHAYWQRTFGGDADVIGRELIIDDEPFTVVGVAQRGFHGTDVVAVDVFLPLSALMRDMPGWTSMDANMLSIAVRMRDGVALRAAEQIATAALRAQDARGSAPEAALISALPGRASRETPQGRIALWLAAVSLIVLLIATANVGTLLSVRAARRRRETAVRLALGAGRGDLARQHLAESVLLTTLGAAAGLVLSRWFADAMRVTLLPNLAVGESLVNLHVLLASGAAAVLCGVLAGLAPLSQARRSDLSAALRSGGRTASARLAFQNVLLTAQVALCTLLLVGAALFVQSLRRVSTQDLGLETSNVLYATLSFRDYVVGAERDLAHEEAVQRLRAVPGVTGATVAQGIPFGPHYIPPVSVPGIAWPPDPDVQIPIMYGATSEYLDIMGVRLLSGRLFTERDDHTAPLVVLVNESMARATWPDGPVIGQCVRIGHGGGPMQEDVNPAASQPCREVVGVVRDSRARSLRPEGNEDRLMQYYVPYAQSPEMHGPDPARAMGMLVRVAGDVEEMAPVVQRALQVGSALRVFARVRSYHELVDPQLRSWRLGASLFSAFGMLALTIAAVGLFAVVSFLTAQRTQEMGVRLALGGSVRGVALLVVGDAVRRAGIGAVLGVLAALALGPVLASMLFQTSPREPTSIVAAVALLIVVTVLASSLPALRAGRVHPGVTLRSGD